MRKPPRPESFEKFYYAKVGMGEACGCAERIIDVYEFNRKAGQADYRQLTRPVRWRLSRLWARLIGRKTEQSPE